VSEASGYEGKSIQFQIGGSVQPHQCSVSFFCLRPGKLGSAPNAATCWTIKQRSDFKVYKSTLIATDSFRDVIRECLCIAFLSIPFRLKIVSVLTIDMVIAGFVSNQLLYDGFRAHLAPTL